MRRLLLIVVLALITAGLAQAQDWENPEFLKRLDLEEQQIQQLRAILERTEREIREARIEVDILKAQLRKLLFEAEVNMREVERLLRQSLDWELKERMAHIRRQVELRELLGDGKYARLSEAVERRRQAQEQQERERIEKSERAEGGRR